MNGQVKKVNHFWPRKKWHKITTISNLTHIYCNPKNESKVSQIKNSQKINQVNAYCKKIVKFKRGGQNELQNRDRRMVQRWLDSSDRPWTRRWVTRQCCIVRVEAGANTLPGRLWWCRGCCCLLLRLHCQPVRHFCQSQGHRYHSGPGEREMFNWVFRQYPDYD